jgi:hypothetical protein
MEGVALYILKFGSGLRRLVSFMPHPLFCNKMVDFRAGMDTVVEERVFASAGYQTRHPLIIKY